MGEEGGGGGEKRPIEGITIVTLVMFSFINVMIALQPPRRKLSINTRKMTTRDIDIKDETNNNRKFY